ncbi:MAG: diaminopimelate epimerase [Prolixibacteraceae bacterium]|nr:diaminopimelate epimerase [Prolixibacteraceae bacterium]MBN2649269.1 diaminopimelate epimerase [Prolixibacteraceae bacterium]
MKYTFYKYQGAGNDFIMIDNRTKVFNGKNAKLIEFLCHRRFGVGADGLITLESSGEFDFEMKYYNSDGYEAEMCGNGGRCITAFARKLGVIEQKAWFMAADGEHEALIGDDNLVDLKMSDVNQVEIHSDGYFLNTGVPHLVHFVDDLNVVDVELEGRQLRYDARFQPAGTNVDFVKHEGDQLTVYTYERGVECETLACGTGITASALSAAYKSDVYEGRYFITAKGGKLEVKFKREGEHFTNVWLKGPAEFVYEGFIDASDFTFPEQ